MLILILLLRFDNWFIDEREKPAINALSELPGQDLCVCTDYLRCTAHLLGYSCTNHRGAPLRPVLNVEALVLNHLLT